MKKDINPIEIEDALLGIYRYHLYAHAVATTSRCGRVIKIEDMDNEVHDHWKRDYDVQLCKDCSNHLAKEQYEIKKELAAAPELGEYRGR